jgi:hypothetical protein
MSAFNVGPIFFNLEWLLFCLLKLEAGIPRIELEIFQIFESKIHYQGNFVTFLYSTIVANLDTKPYRLWKKNKTTCNLTTLHSSSLKLWSFSWFLVWNALDEMSPMLFVRSSDMFSFTTNFRVHQYNIFSQTVVQLNLVLLSI